MRNAEDHSRALLRRSRLSSPGYEPIYQPRSEHNITCLHRTTAEGSLISMIGSWATLDQGRPTSLGRRPCRSADSRFPHRYLDGHVDLCGYVTSVLDIQAHKLDAMALLSWRDADNAIRPLLGPCRGLLRARVRRRSGYLRPAVLAQELPVASLYESRRIAAGRPRIFCPTIRGICTPVSPFVHRTWEEELCLEGAAPRVVLMPRNPFTQRRGPMRCVVAPAEGPRRPGRGP
ncbi:hypothetical protein VUR80DRAFT_6423 [Thermomyces stellatus]